ncbi:hypothetical protein CRUP_023848 [Coryphaenoides rupestris]|nr:hypothetical protein CRUP_023848 [Coryphaenoides rupestris]
MYLLMSLGGRDDDGQDADELEDGPQEEAVAQQALQEGRLRDLRGRQVQLRGHGAGHGLTSEFTVEDRGVVVIEAVGGEGWVVGGEVGQHQGGVEKLVLPCRGVPLHWETAGGGRALVLLVPGMVELNHLWTAQHRAPAQVLLLYHGQLLGWTLSWGKGDEAAAASLWDVDPEHQAHPGVLPARVRPPAPLLDGDLQDLGAVQQPLPAAHGDSLTQDAVHLVEGVGLWHPPLRRADEDLQGQRTPAAVAHELSETRGHVVSGPTNTHNKPTHSYLNHRMPSTGGLDGPPAALRLIVGSVVRPGLLLDHQLVGARVAGQGPLQRGHRCHREPTVIQEGGRAPAVAGAGPRGRAGEMRLPSTSSSRLGEHSPVAGRCSDEGSAW